MHRLIVLILPFCISFLGLSSQPTLIFDPVPLNGSVSQPVDIAHAGDGSGRLFIVEKRGSVRIIQNGNVLASAFLDISGSVVNTNERGMLGLVFHPQFPDSAYFYVNYIGTGDTTHIARFTVNPVNPNDALENSEKTILKIAQPGTNHNAGDLAFGTDGYLYIGLGDGGGSGDPDELSQNEQTLLGKMLRIDINTTQPYLIPGDNPFTDHADVLDEIWAIGLRNPWRFSFDPITGDLWIADVGQGAWEEVHIQPADSPGGENYGWDCYEASANFEPTNCANATGTLVFPDFEYPHINQIPNGWTQGYGNSITGGFVYRGSQYPSLYGYYICADYIHNQAWLLKQQAGSANLEVINFDFSGEISGISTFGEDENGELYAASLNGTLYQVRTDEILAIEELTFQLQKRNDGVLVQWKYTGDTGDVLGYSIERSTDGVDFEKIHLEKPGKETHTYFDPQPSAGRNHYRIGIEDISGNIEYTSIRSILFNHSNLFEIATVQNGSSLEVSVSAHSGDIRLMLFDIQGREIGSMVVPAGDESTIVSFRDFSNTPGLYVLKATDGTLVQSKRLVAR